MLRVLPSLVIALLVCGCRRGERADHAKTTPQPVSQGVRPGQSCGMCLAHSWQDGGRAGYGTETSAASLEELHALGVRSISLTPFGWMETLQDSEVKYSRTWVAAENFDRLRRESKRAVELGMSIMLKPHLWIGRGEWRGKIAPAGEGGWESWLASYEKFILSHADLANEIGAEWLCIGVELISVTRTQPEFFRQLIPKVRARYDGKLTYGANWDEVLSLSFWSDLDAIGVQFFAPLLEDGQEPTQETLDRGARMWLERYSKIATEAGKPILLTEAGYTNMTGTSRNPWRWPKRVQAKATGAGDQEQARAYRAVLKTFGRSAHVDAIYWWKWFTDPQTDEEGDVGFSPRGKLTEAVLRNACRVR